MTDALSLMAALLAASIITAILMVAFMALFLWMADEGEEE